MTSLDIVGTVRRLGNSLALVIPAREARRAGIRPGGRVRAHVETDAPAPLGLLADLDYQPFAREGLWRDRI